jgi:hypothetical protein
MTDNVKQPSSDLMPGEIDIYLVDCGAFKMLSFIEPLRSPKAPTAKYYRADLCATKAVVEYLDKAEKYLREIYPHDAPSSARKVAVIRLFFKIRKALAAIKSTDGGKK